MRSLRTIYNKAASKRLVKNKEPFKGVFTGNERTVKRSISTEDIRKLSQYCPYSLSPGSFLIGRGGEASASDLFSFYAMGMPFVDLAHLKRPQIRTGCLPTNAARRAGGRESRRT